MSDIKLKHISVGKNCVWAAGAADGTIFRLFGDAGLVGWAADKSGKANVVAAVDWANAWCVNQKGEIWQVTNAENLDKGGVWTKIPTQSGQADARTISVGADGTVWYAQTDGKLFRREGGAWQADPSGKAAVIAAVSKTQIWGVNQAREIWHLESGAWTKIPTQSGKPDAGTISAGADGTVWYAQTDGAIFRREGNTWHSVDGRATVLAVNSKDDIWCVNSAGEVFYRLPDTWRKFVESSPNMESWIYMVRQGDHLLQIVRTQYQVQDAAVVNRIADEIARLSKLANRDSLAIGQKLIMPPLNYRG